MGDVPPPPVPPVPPAPPKKKGWLDAIWDGAKAVGKFIVTAPGKVWSWVKSAASTVWSWINGLLTWLCSWSILFAIVIMLAGIVLAYFGLVGPGVVVFIIGLIALFCRWV